MAGGPSSALLIENEPEWRRRLEAALQDCGVARVETINSFAEAERVLPNTDLFQFSFAVLDVRMRKHLFDQGGLYLLDRIKVRRPPLPVLLLSAYFSDYPGIKAVTDRYRKVIVREKEEFLKTADGLVALLTNASSYDAFLSYRHQPPDREFARGLHRTLEVAGYRVALDERDFAANESFLAEMERCVRESRFTLAVITPRYLESGNTQEEAIICKVLDMDERRRRLVPLVLEKTRLPGWMFNLVGIDFTATDAVVAPLEKLRMTLGAPW